jgi:hypothetical protein
MLPVCARVGTPDGGGCRAPAGPMFEAPARPTPPLHRRHAAGGRRAHGQQDVGVGSLAAQEPGGTASSQPLPAGSGGKAPPHAAAAGSTAHRPTVPPLHTVLLQAAGDLLPDSEQLRSSAPPLQLPAASAVRGAGQHPGAKEGLPAVPSADALTEYTLTARPSGRSPRAGCAPAAASKAVAAACRQEQLHPEGRPAPNGPALQQLNLKSLAQPHLQQCQSGDSQQCSGDGWPQPRGKQLPHLQRPCAGGGDSSSGRPCYGRLPRSTAHARTSELRAWREAQQRDLLQLVTVRDPPPAVHGLLAATRAAVAALPHEALAAMFDRVTREIDRFGLAAVQEGGEEGKGVEEEEEEWEEVDEGDYGESHSTGSDDSSRSRSSSRNSSKSSGGGVRRRAPVSGRAHMIGPLGDATFLTAVGLLGELRGGTGQEPGPEPPLQPPAQPGQGPLAALAGHGELLSAAAGGLPGPDDPTERLAVALGLDVSHLAHHRPPGPPRGDCAAAAARLRNALRRPLVHAGAGDEPDQHHTRPTAGSIRKRRAPKWEAGAATAAAAAATASAGGKARVLVGEGLGSAAAAMRGRLQVRRGGC